MRIGVLMGMSAVWAGMAMAAPSDTKPTTLPLLDLPSLMADPAGAVRSYERLERMRNILAATTPLEKASVELAMANWLLAVPTASPATRWLVGVPAPDDLQRIHEAARIAQEHLARARKLLGADAAEPRERWRELRASASVLEGFAKLFFVCAGDPQATSYANACESAAVGLAASRESETQAIAAAAMMWQAHAFALADRTDRALSTLPEALVKPERQPYDFLSRVLRCRILAESGQPAAAIALAMRMRGLCDEWFPQLDNAAVRARSRLVAVVQAKVTQDWLADLGEAPASETLAGTLIPLQEGLLAPGQRNPVYHLETALPIIVEAPPLVAPEPAPKGATQPRAHDPEPDGTSESAPSERQADQAATAPVDPDDDD